MTGVAELRDLEARYTMPTYVRAGVEFKAIEPIPAALANKKDAALIQVGSSRLVLNQPTLGVDTIRNLRR